MTYKALRILSSALVVVSILLTGSASAAVSCPSLKRTLTFGSRGADVTQLQLYLASDATIYPEGVVSGYFGRATEKAVQRFQAKRGIVSNGTPASTGYGAVGVRTRVALANCATAAVQTVAATTTLSQSPTTPLATTTPVNPLVTYANDATTTITLGAGVVPSIVTFSFIPKIVEIPGNTTNMTWTSTNASNCSIDKLVNGTYSLLHENVGPNGSTNLVVSDSPTTFSLRCNGLGDASTSSPASIRRDVSAHIRYRKPTCTITTDKNSYVYTKDTIILKWTTEDADNITWVHSASAVDPVALPYGNQLPSGTLMLSSVAGTSQNVTLNVSGNGGSATCSKSFSIAPAS